MKRLDSPFVRIIGLSGAAVGILTIIFAWIIWVGMPWWIGIFIWFCLIGIGSWLVAAFKTRMTRILDPVVILGLFLAAVIGIGLVGWGVALSGTLWWCGLFLILPAGWLWVGMRRHSTWRENRRLYYTSLVMTVLVISGFMSLSFVKNIAILQSATRTFPQAIVLQGDVISDVITLDRFRQHIQDISAKNQEFRFPRFGLNESLIFEERLKRRYVDMFREGLLEPMDHQTAETLAAVSVSTPQSRYGSYVVYLARRINILRQVLSGNRTDPTETSPSLFLQPMKDIFGDTIIPEVIDKIHELYLLYAAWSDNPTGLNNEMKDLQTWLKHLLTMEDVSLRWMSDVVDRDLSKTAQHITLENFWGVPGKAISSNQVDPVFTVEGYHAVQTLLSEIENALHEPLIIATKKVSFMNWYRTAYISAWETFVTAFPTGKAMLDANGWRRVAEQTAAFEGPYGVLLDTLERQWEAFHELELENLPWIDLAIGFKLSVDSWDRKDSGTARGLVDKLKTVSGRVPFATGIKFNRTDEAGRYKTALASIGPILASRKGAVDSIRQAFENEPGTSNPFADAYRSVDDLKKTLSTDERNAKIFWDLVQGPIDLLFEFAVQESSCYLQERWEKEVLLEVQGISDTVRTSLLFGQNGYAVQFLNAALAPFIQRTLTKGYFPKAAYGVSLPFNQAFIDFLNVGIKTLMQSEKTFNLFVEGRPTDVNPESAATPHVTVLEFRCKDLKQKLFLSDRPKSNTFEWSDQSCHRIDLLIGIGENVLIKTYDGSNAITDFLNDFENGGKTFAPDDFPKFETALEIMNIRQINVHLAFSWQQPILDHYKNLAARPIKVPTSIAACWN